MKPAHFFNNYKRKNKSEEFFVHCIEILLSLHKFNYIVLTESLKVFGTSRNNHIKDANRQKTKAAKAHTYRGVGAGGIRQYGEVRGCS